MSQLYEPYPLPKGLHYAEESTGLPVAVTPLRFSDDDDIIVRDDSNGKEVLITVGNFTRYYISESVKKELAESIKKELAEAESAAPKIDKNAK